MDLFSLKLYSLIQNIFFVKFRRRAKLNFIRCKHSREQSADINLFGRLPMAHTCFNQLVLPAYKNKKILKQKMIIAVQNAEGFGIE